MTINRKISALTQSILNGRLSFSLFKGVVEEAEDSLIIKVIPLRVDKSRTEIQPQLTWLDTA